MNLVNKPRVSKFIAGSYLAVAVFIAICIGSFTYAGFFTPMGTVGLIAAVVAAFVEVVMLLILASLYRTKYVLTGDALVIRASRLIGGNKRIPLKEVTGVEKTLIPFGVRLFGASFHGGYYLVPGLGRAFVAVTNFEDGVLLKTKHENYIITPENPDDFIEVVHGARK